MGKQDLLDLLVSLTIDHDFPAKASHCNTFFISLRAVQDDHVILGKDAKGKGKGKDKTRAKTVKGGKCSAEEQDVKESTDKPRIFVAFGKVSFLWLTKWSFFFFGPFFRFLYPRTFFCFRFFHRSNRKELPRGNFCQVREVNKNMQMT